VRSKSSFANSKDAAELRSAGQPTAAVPTCYLIAVAAFLLMLSAAPLFAQVPRGPIMGGGIMSPPVNQRPPGLEFVGIEQHLNAEVPVDLEFRDELGNPVKLADYFRHGRPVILNLGYYQCPMLCSELLQGLVGSMKALTFNIGQDFDILTVSFDPRETTEMAAAKKRARLTRSMRSPKRWASNISSIRKPSSTPTPPPLLC
jgi:cytochrome oxidase Cu insertion factor (SCO1/SenC/PrrC family)